MESYLHAYSENGEVEKWQEKKTETERKSTLQRSVQSEQKNETISQAMSVLSGNGQSKSFW